MPDKADDVKLVERIAGGDADALGELYDRYGRVAFGVLYRMLPGPEAAEEVTQDAFHSVWRQARSYRAERGSVRTWLLAICRNAAITYARALAGVADGRVVALAPTGANPDARAAVVIPSQGSPYLIVRLPAPPAGKAWEAWVLKPGTSGPVALPAGTAERGDVFTLSLTAPLGAGDGVAITLEPASGSAQPTTQPVLVVEKT